MALPIFLILKPSEFNSVVNLKTLTEGKHFRPAAGAALTVICGLVLWKSSLGDAWVNTSYDYLFRFGSHPVTNKVVVILMDNEAYDHFHQTRGQPWDRALDARLLNRLADDGSSIVVLDLFLWQPHRQAEDEALAAALRRQRCIVLAAGQAEVTHPTLAGAHPTLPSEPFLSAAGTNWGVAWLDPDLDSIVRRHWPFPAPGPYPSLSRTTARLAGGQLDDDPREQWLRYYGRYGAWTRLSYRFALTQPADYFRDRIVFIGTEPKTTVVDGENDKFCTPYTRWTGKTVGGVEILITAFLNLMKGDWLRRPAWWSEAFVLVSAGTLLGWAFCRTGPVLVGVLAVGVFLATALGAVSWSYYTNYWFPWFVIAGGQVPCALLWALGTQRIGAQAPATVTTMASSVVQTVEPVAAVGPAKELPDIPDYELVNPPFGRGACGKVWLARNAIGQWQALKVVYLANFDGHVDSYEREFNGIKRYKPISDQHPGLLRVDFVSRMKRAGYFYYVMELGDGLDPGWEREPSTYKPRDLVNERRRYQGLKVPARECVRIGLALADALAYLHGQGLTHRDIKPQNVIFVNGQPRLADVGLVAEIRAPDRVGTWVGTPGYMPPPPESPGTPQADIYALGMVLYVLSTGRNASFFPEISTSLVGGAALADFWPLNSIIVKACDPDCARRYGSAAEMCRALEEAQKSLG